MLRESLHLQRLVDDLLELTRLQNADFRIEKAPLELRQLAEDVRRSARRLAEPKGVVLTWRAALRNSPLPAIMADSVRCCLLWWTMP